MDKYTLSSEKERKNEKRKKRERHNNNNSGNRNHSLYVDVFWKKRKKRMEEPASERHRPSKSAREKKSGST
jgi:hypothetical protein